ASDVLGIAIAVGRLAGCAWGLGSRCITELSDEEVERLLPRPPQAPEQKRISEVALQLDLPDRTRIVCRIQRLSVPGSWPLAAGTTMAIRTNPKKHGLPLLKLKVVRCWLDGENWTLHCLLLNPSDELLRALLNRRSP